MTDIVAARPATAGPRLAGRQKPGPKGRVLEPYAREVLLKVREGQSMQSIANWLAEPPRSVDITRQAVHCWVKARIKKLVKLNAAFVNTGICGPFLESGVVVRASRPPEKASDIDHERLALKPLAHASKSAAPPTGKRVDIREFMVDESELNRSQNPLIPKT